MATAHVRHAVGDEWFTSDTSATVAWGANTTTGNLIVVGIYWSSETVTITNITDSQSNTYTLIGSPTVDSGQGWSGQVAYAPNIIGGTTPTITVTFSGAITNKNVLALEASGCESASPVDGFGSNADGFAGGTDTVTSGAYTTTTDGDYLAGFVIQHLQNNNITGAGTNYTLRSQNNAHSQRASSESQIQATASASTVATWTSSAFCRAIILGAAFKVAAGGPALPDLDLRLEEPELYSVDFE